MYEITEESTRSEERREQKQYMASAGVLGFMFLLVAIVDLSSPWYYKMLISIGAAAYLIGYCKAYPVFYEWMMRDHPMRHSSNYRMTDGHVLAFTASIIWPLLWLSRSIVRAIKSARA